MLYIPSVLAFSPHSNQICKGFFHLSETSYTQPEEEDTGLVSLSASKNQGLFNAGGRISPVALCHRRLGFGDCLVGVWRPARLRFHQTAQEW